MVLITEVELGLLLPKIGGKVSYPTPISINFVKWVSERITPCG